MDKFDRIFQLHNVLSGRRTAIAGEELMARLECSKATLHRVINALRDALGAPIVFDAHAGGYRYDTTGNGTSYELPGLWFSDSELQAMALMQRHPAAEEAVDRVPRPQHRRMYGDTASSAHVISSAQPS